MNRPRIKKTTEIIESPEGDLYLMRPSAGADIRIEAPDGEQRALLAALDGTQSRELLADRFGEELVGDTLAQLEELGAIEDGADDDLLGSEVIARFDRQLRYFSWRARAWSSSVSVGSGAGPPGRWPAAGWARCS
jgi:hypothetical protein